MATLVHDSATEFKATAATTELPLTENAIRVLRARYLKKNEAGEPIERPEDLFRRVARTVAAIEARHGADEQKIRLWEQRFYELMVSGRFMPNSPTLMNAGREMGLLSACFVLPVRDSIDEIFESIKHTALIQKAGGGTGFAFDELRPTGDYIRSSGGTTSGPISFWRVFSEATNAIQQGAFRRGANMGMMYIHHPDILKFLHAKQDLQEFTNYNISVKVPNEWMRSLENEPDSPHVVTNPRTGEQFYIPKDVDIWTYTIRSLVPVSAEAQASDAARKSPPSKEPAAKYYTKRDIWQIIVTNAWATGEPGVVFIDRINEDNPTPHVGRIEATNPCGEQPLLPYEACNLGSINLGAFVRHACTPQAEVDWDGLREAVHTGVRFLDNVIDANRYPLPAIEQMCQRNRKIGLGVMGFADALYQLNVPYNSEEGLAWAERFMKFVNDEAHNCSERLAAERGCFPNWRGSVWETKHHRPMRNAAVTTVAPTGTISIIANCSGGIEPLFSLAFYRNVLKGQSENDSPMIEINRIFRRVAVERGFYSEGLMERIAKEGTLASLEQIPEDVKRVFVCAHDISPEWHVRMQAAFQRHCDASISKTINFPNEATVEQVDTIFRMAYKLRCKGVTVYRDGCRSSQPMALASSERKFHMERGRRLGRLAMPSDSQIQKQAPATVAPPELEPRDLPEIVSGLRIRQMTPFGNMHVKITVDPKTERELEVFAQLGKGGDVATSDLEAICRMISLWLRAGGSLTHVIRQLKDIGSSLQVPTKDGKIRSLGDGVARALMKYRRAKETYGLRALLLGEAGDLSRMNWGSTARGEAAPRRAAGPGRSDGDSKGGNGNGNGKGNGQRHGVRHAEAADLVWSSSAEAPAAAGDAGATPASLAFKLKCPECGDRLVYMEGCHKCHSCGYGQC